MNSKIKMTVAVLVSAALGAAAILALHAQAKPPTLVVIDVNEITDAEGYKANSQRAPANTETTKLGGRYIARTDKITALDGTPPKRTIIIAFDSPEKA